VTIKGSPEAVMALCGLTAERRLLIEKQIQHMASQGLRLLGVAKARFQKRSEAWPESGTRFKFEWLGLSQTFATTVAFGAMILGNRLLVVISRSRNKIFFKRSSYRTPRRVGSLAWLSGCCGERNAHSSCWNHQFVLV
jgi:hypothetical protein